LNLRSSRSSEQ
jgi:hypothetical protein